MVAIPPLPMHSFFLYATAKAWDRLKAWWKTHQKQFTGIHAMVQCLVWVTSSSPIRQTVTAIHSHTFAPPTLYQVEYRTSTQSWLGLYTSHLMTGKLFTLPNNTFKEYHCPHSCLCKKTLFTFIYFKIWNNRTWCEWSIKLLAWSREQYARCPSQAKRN